MNSLPYNSHRKHYFKLLKVIDWCKVKILIHMFERIKQHLLSNSDIHDHNSRNSHKLIASQINRTRSQSSWLYQGIELPDCIS